MFRSPLSAHKFDKGLFTTPMNDVMGSLLQTNSWFHERLPEYLWIGLIHDSFLDRKEGIRTISKIMRELYSVSQQLPYPCLSGIFSLDTQLQKKFYEVLENNGCIEFLEPLSLLYTFSEQPLFNQIYYSKELEYLSLRDKLESVIRKMSDRHSRFATDVRYCVIAYRVMNGFLHIPVAEIKKFTLYEIVDDEEKLDEIGLSIGVCEMTFFMHDEKFVEDFWKKCASLYECKSFMIAYEKDIDDDKANKYYHFLKDMFCYYGDLYRIDNPYSDKMLVLLGIASYSFKRFSEIIDHNLYNAISGRSIVRVMIEDFIMMKYLLTFETQKDNVWLDFQTYGMGQLKLLTERYRQNGNISEKEHVDYKYLDVLVDVFMNRELLNMDTKYFDKKSIREKAIAVNEKDLFDTYYDYDSSFEHGLWGAIRESVIMGCDAPGHQFHNILDVKNVQKMKSVWHDSVMIMNKTLNILIDQFGLSDELRERAHEYGV